MPKVVRIDNKDEVPTAGEPCDNVVSLLEDLLQAARSGEIVGVAGVRVYPGKEGYLRTASGFWGGYCDSYSSVGGLDDVKFCMLKRMND